MLAAFRWNLRVLSYIALVVGAFLIYNTISVSVVRRRAGDRHPARARRHAAACWGISCGSGLLSDLLGGTRWCRAGPPDGGGRCAAGGRHRRSRSMSAAARRPSRSRWSVGAARASRSASSCRLLSALSPAWEASQVAPVEAMARGRARTRRPHAQVARLCLSAPRSPARPACRSRSRRP